MNSKNNWVGIDYGSKMAGTTAICYHQDSQLHILQSEKKQDADAFISQFLQTHVVENLYLDAPLSLPDAYFNKGEDFFYRACDRETKAMSPMFLGGLTARAMKLKSMHPDVNFFECYPAYLVKKVLSLGVNYLKKEKYNSELETILCKKYNLSLKQGLENWHQLDALCCWLTGLRHLNKLHLELGNESEGQIII